MKKFITIILLWFVVFVASGDVLSDSVRTYFNLSKWQYDPTLNRNTLSMESFVDTLRVAINSGGLDSIVIRGYASPDGPFKLNQTLARKRSETIAKYVIAQADASHDKVLAESGGIAWNELLKIVTANKDVPSRDKILAILNSSAIQAAAYDETTSQRCLNRLAALDGGKPYKWLLDNIFPELRYAIAILHYTQPDCEISSTEIEPVTEIATDTVSIDVEREEIIFIEPTVEPPVIESTPADRVIADEIATHHILALKTNLLYYAALLPNIELEWLFNDNWSVALEGNFTSIRNKERFKYYDLYIIDAEIRRWIKPREPWHGMFVGLFTGGGWYDLENGGRGHRGEGGMAGLSFGYMWPVNRTLSFEASAGAGYMYTRYKEYVPYQGHFVYERTKSLNYFGPLKVKFSLVWRFWDQNKSKRIIPAI